MISVIINSMAAICKLSKYQILQIITWRKCIPGNVSQWLGNGNSIDSKVSIEIEYHTDVEADNTHYNINQPHCNVHTVK